MSNQTDLRNALLVVGIENINLPYPIKWPNAPFPEQSSGSTWVRVTPLYGAPTEYAINKTDRIDGVLQIDIFVPSNNGDIVANEICDTLRTALPSNGGKLTSGNVSVQFSRVGLSGQGMPDGAWTKYMFTANFLTFVDRTL